MIQTVKEYSIFLFFYFSLRRKQYKHATFLRHPNCATKRKNLATPWVTVDKLSIPECARLFDESRREGEGEGGSIRPWVDSKKLLSAKIVRRHWVTPLTSSFRLAFHLCEVFFSRARARRGAARKEDRICEMAVHEGWISDEVIRGGWSGPPCRGRGKSCKGEKFEVNSIEIGGSTIYFVTGLTSCHPFPFDSMHVRNDSPRCARLFRRETTGWVVFTFMDIIMRSFVRFFSFFFFVEDITVLQDVIREEAFYTNQEKEKERLHECRKCYAWSLLRVYRVSYFYLHVDFYTLYRFL